MPPNHRSTPPKGAPNNDALPSQRMCIPSANAASSTYGKSQLLVCGAAMTTQRAGRGKCCWAFEVVDLGVLE